MSEGDTSTDAVPITFDWTGIQYPTNWEDSYTRYKGVTQSGRPPIQPLKPISFSHITESLQTQPDVLAWIRQLPSEVAVSSGSAPGATLVREHRDQHSQCLACHQLIHQLGKEPRQTTPHQKSTELSATPSTSSLFQILMYNLLPREETGKTVKVATGDESYIPGRNLPYVPFRQIDDDGQKKREFVPYSTVLANASSGTNTSQLNYANLQLDLSSKNLDDLHRDVLKIKTQIGEELDLSEKILAHTELLEHEVSDLTKAQDKIKDRLDVVEQLLSLQTALLRKLRQKKPSPDWSTFDSDIGR